MTVRLLLALFVLAQAAALAAPDSRTVLLRPVAEEFDASELEGAARIIRRRLVTAGLTAGVHVKVDHDAGIFVQMRGLEAAEQDRVLELARPRGMVEFRLVMPWRGDPISLDDLAPSALTGILSGAEVQLSGPPAGPTVFLHIHEDHQAAFGALTGENVGERLAIVVDGQILTAPQVQAPIIDSAQISGFASEEEAIRIAALLNAGALPFDLEVVER